MADRTNAAKHAAAAQGMAGFTLAEMLAALGILLFGVVSLLGAMTASIGQRRSTDAKLELAALCEHALQRVQQECVRAPGDAADPLDLEFVPLVDQPAPGFAGMTWSATATADESKPLVWLVRIEVRWYEAGDVVTAEFLRVVPRQLPLRDRVSSFRGDNPESATR
jgi:type II secretory pathway pseudopilin PulG